MPLPEGTAWGRAQHRRTLADPHRGYAPWEAIDIEKAISWVECRTGKKLSPSQGEAVRLVLSSKLCVVTGGPGVGKTSTLDPILRILTAKGVRVALAAPTAGLPSA